MNADLRAVQAAHDTLRLLNVDQSRRIDIYDALDRCGFFLAFSPLEGVLGVSLPRLDGVLVTTRRKPPIQRYTAAHELGHCILHNDLIILDDESKILDASPVEKERQAQLFASAFLMPADLVFLMADRNAISAGNASPSAVGRAARDMGVSFEATARRLVDLDRLSGNDFDHLMRRRSSWRREELFGVAPGKGVLDVWGVRANTQSAELTVTTGDQVTILLPENRTTGYRWIPGHVEAGADDGGVDVAADDFRTPTPTEEVLVGQQGERLISLRPFRAGSVTLTWTLARPFSPQHAVANYSAHFEILPSPSLQRVRQIRDTALDSALPERLHRFRSAIE